MIILGLTGSIGMGKSVVGAMFRRLGVPVHDADAAVHRLLGKGGCAVAAVEAAFPGVVENGAVDRRALGARVFGSPAALARLEGILHPMVRQHERRFLRRAALHRRRLVVLDVPLLFETGGGRRCDATIVVSAPPFVQAQRVLRRPGMTRQRLGEILARQTRDTEKRRLADFVIATGLGRAFTLRAVIRIITMSKPRQGCRWPPPGRRSRHRRPYT